jgi:porphobilinogen deaminase
MEWVPILRIAADREGAAAALAAALAEALRDGNGPPDEVLLDPAAEATLQDVLDGDLDVLVLHAVDLPARLPLGLIAEIVLERRDPRTVAVVASSPPTPLRELPASSRVICPSDREAALLRALHPDLAVAPGSGEGMGPAEVDRALERVGQGEAHAVLLPAWVWALHRSPGLGAEYLPRTVWIPRPGEGGTAVVSAISSPGVPSAIAPLIHPSSRGEIMSELSFLEAVDPRPSVVVLSTALSYGSGLRLWGLLLDSDGRRAVRVDRTGELAGPEPLGWELAADTVARSAGVLA